MITWLARIAASLLLIWALGFAVFVVTLPGPADEAVTDVIVVPTGGVGRIARGADLLERHLAKRMFISGVDAKTSARQIARTNKLKPQLFACCVDLGHEASNTRANAEETMEWLRARHAKSVRLVTTDWHMPRARLELDRVVGPGIVILNDAVDSHADFAVLMREYNKFLVRRLAVLEGA